jgi:hypothetical protein
MQRLQLVKYILDYTKLLRNSNNNTAARLTIIKVTRFVMRLVLEGYSKCVRKDNTKKSTQRLRQSAITKITEEATNAHPAITMLMRPNALIGF